MPFEFGYYTEFSDSVTKADPDPVDTAVDTLLGGETA